MYVGQTSQKIANRFKDHLKWAKKKINKHLYDAMNCHGYENFIIELVEDEISKEDIDNKEIHYISFYKTLSPLGYNMTKGGGGGYTLGAWSEEDRAALYKQQGDNRRGPRPDWWKKSISDASKIRESLKTDEDKKRISLKISNTNKEKGIRPPPIALFGKDNPNYVDVNTVNVLDLIKNGKKLKDIAAEYNTTTVTIWSKLKETGKTFYEWKKYYESIK